MITAPRAPHPERPRTHRRLAALVALALPLIVLACSTPQEGATVDSSLTQTAAQTRMVELLASSLSALPATASLDVTSPRAPQNPLQTTTTAPCNDDDTTSSGPVNLGMSRWAVDGNPPQPVGAVASVTAVWSAAGWSVDTRSDGSAVTTTPDGYTLTAQTSVQGDLSIGAGSPCFPRENTGGPSAPKVIARPAG